MALKPISGEGSSPSILHARNREGELHRISLAAVPLIASSDKERQLELRRLGGSVLNPGKSWPSVDWRQFALMHNETSIRDTSWESGFLSDSITAWRSLIKLAESGEELLFMGITVQQLRRCIDFLDDLDEFDQYIPKIRLGVQIGDLILKGIASKWLSLLGEKLPKKSSVYLPLGYSPGIRQTGHLIIGKFSLKEGNVHCQLLNSGNGSAGHAVLDFTTTDDLSSLRYFPISIPKGDFFGELGHAAFCHLIRLMWDFPDPAHKPIEGEMVYDILLTIGTVVADLGDDPYSLAIRGQIGGVCPEAGVRNLLQDVLVDMHLSSETRELFFTNIYLFSLIAGYHNFVAHPIEKYREQLVTAAGNFGIAAEEKKRKGLLTFEEYRGLTGLLLEIKKRAFVLSPPLSTPMGLRETALQPIDSFPALFPKPAEVEIAPTGMKGQVQESAPKQPPRRLVPRWSPDTFLQDLDLWIDQIDKSGSSAFSFLQSCSSCLPIPTCQEKDSWDAIPVAKIPELIAKLERFVKKGLAETSVVDMYGGYRASFIEHVLVIYTYFAVIDKLARRQSECKLSGFASPFIPSAYHFEHSDFFALPLGVHQDRYAQISNYFKECGSKYFTPDPIFPIAPLLPIEQYILDARQGGRKSQGTNHIQFLQLQIFAQDEKIHTKGLLDACLKVFGDMPSQLPQAVCTLYYFSYLAASCFFAGSGTLYPQELKFKETYDENGKRALEIESGDQKTLEQHPKKERFFEYRFDEMTLDTTTDALYRESFFSREKAKMTTNEAVCARLSNDEANRFTLSEAVYRDLLRITRKRNLAPAMALQWAGNNLLHLENPLIQKTLYGCLFIPHSLNANLREEPLMIGTCRDLVRRGLAYLRENPHHLDTILFLIHIGLCFETQYAAIYGPQECQEMVQFYITRIDALSTLGNPSQTQALQLHRIFAQIVDFSKNEAEILEVFKFCFGRFALERSQRRYGWLFNQLPTFARQLAERLENEFEEPTFRDRVCTALSAHFLPEESQTLTGKHWEGHFPIFSCDKVVVDFHQSKIFYTGKGELALLEGICGYSMSEHFASKHGTKFWDSRDDRGYESVDGKLRIRVDQTGRVIFEREIMLEGKPRWAHVHRYLGERQQKELDFLNAPEHIPLLHYILLDRKAEDPLFVSYDYHSDLPVFRIDQAAGGMEVRRLDGQGQPLPGKLVNLSTLKEGRDHPLYDQALRFAHPSQILCFVNSDTHQVEELFFFVASLRFVRTAHGLESREYPGYYLRPGLSLEEINHFPPALVLQNREGEIKVIIPAVKCQPLQENFSNQLVATHEYYSLQHWVFQLDRLTGSLIHPDRMANLYLALILTMQKMERRAFYYLQKGNFSSSFEKDEWSLIQGFFRVQGRAPAALAIKCQLLYRVLDNHQVMSEVRLNKGEERENDLTTISLHIYHDYLTVLKNETLSPIPKELRLTPEQERTILRFLKRQYKKYVDTPLPQLLTLRYELLCAGKEKVTAKIKPKEISLRPFSFAHLQSPKELHRLTFFQHSDQFRYGSFRRVENWEDSRLIPFANRMSGVVVEVHFPELYEEARKCPRGKPDPFDLTLLALLEIENGQYDVQGHLLGLLLFYVRHFPHLFTDLSLVSVTTEREKAAVFDGILKKAMELEYSIEYRKFKEKFLGEKTTFSYTRETELRVPQEEDRGIVALFEKAPLSSTPLKDLCTLLFKKVDQRPQVPDQPPFLDASNRAPQNSLEGDIDARMEEGYAALKKRVIPIYTLRGENSKVVSDGIRQRREQFHNRLIGLRKDLCLRLNGPHLLFDASQEIAFRLNKLTGQRRTLLPETVMKEAILKGDLGVISRSSPHISSEEVQEIYNLTCDYYQLLALYQVCLEAEELMTKKDGQSLNRLALLLDYNFPDCRRYPEVYYFKVTADKLPYPQQMAIHEWACEGIAKGENRLYQDKTGGGKTEYTSLLLMLRGWMNGLTPVFLSTPMMYAVDKMNLRTYLQRIQKEVYSLEVGLHMQLSAESVQFIYEQLTHYHAQKEGILHITSQTIYALWLQYLHAALLQQNETKVKYLSLIFDFFATKCLLIGDEAHANFDALTRAIFGVGDYLHLLKHERVVFLEMLKPFLGFEELTTDTGKSIREAAHIGANFSVFASEDELKEVQMALARHMSSSSTLAIPLKVREEFVTYWTDNNSDEPKFMEELAVNESEKADQMALVGTFILDVLPYLLRMRPGLDHAPSIFEEEEFDTPCLHKTSSTAQYENPYLTTSASIRGTYHRALFESQIRTLITYLLKKSQKDEEVGKTTSNDLFATWVAGTPAQMHLRDVSLSSPKHMQLLIQALARKPSVLHYYLKHFILPQIGHCLQELQAYPGHLLGHFKVAILDTATPISPLVYPSAVKDFLFNSQHEAEVITAWFREKNQRQIFVDTAAGYFGEMEKNYVSELAAGKVMLDPSGFFCDRRNEEIAEAWLASAKNLDGVFYFKEAHSLNVDKDEKVMLLLRGRREPLEVGGTSAIEKTVKQLFPQKWDKMEFGTYFDASHTESANVHHKKGTAALVFVGDRLIQPRLIQALGRLRGWLLEEMLQSVIWVYPREVAQKISPGSQRIEGKALYTWTRKNTAEAMEKWIVEAQYQNISLTIEGKAEAERRKLLHDPKGQIALLQKHQRGYLEDHPHNPYLQFRKHPSKAATETVLRDFAAAKFAQFRYSDDPLDWKGEMGMVITQIIGTVKERIPTIYWGYSQGVVEHHNHIKKQMEQVDLRPRPFNPISAAPVYGKIGVDDPDFPNCFSDARQMYNCMHLTEGFCVSHTHLNTALLAGQEMGTRYLKPIDFFIIAILEDGRKLATVASNEIVSQSLKDLQKGTDNPEVKHRAFLITATGQLIQRGKRRLAPKEEEMRLILQSEWMQDLIIDAALLRGQIAHPDRLLKRLKAWPNFVDFWSKTVATQPNPETANVSGMKRLLVK